MNDKLLPCPFCGGDAEFNDTSSTWVLCEDCGAEIQCQIERKDAAIAWNRRVIASDQLDRMRERAERAEAERADEWRARREAEASRDTALAVAATFRAERDELRAVAIKAQAVLAMFVAPDAIKQTTVINAYAAAVEAETALRTLLTKLQDTSHE